MAIDVTFPTIYFPHRGEFERSEFVNKQETAQDTLAGSFTTAIESFQTQANELETNVNNKEANVIKKHDIVVAKEALMSPHYANIDIVAENIGTIGSKIGVVDIHNATSKATPSDNDELAILDSANSFSLKKLTWANLKNVIFSSPALTGTPTSPTATAGTNTTQIATTAFVKAKSEADSIGVNQTWQDVTSSRSVGVIYTNTTGKPIMVSLRIEISGALIATLSVQGIEVSSLLANSSYQPNMEFQAIVPDGNKYVLSGGAIQKWSELR